jgi:3-hydroxyisobutyrate dehydrogenase-like beta-hydroxyacid dehydrogenase
MKVIAFIGLGVMGFHMAGHIQNSGNEVFVYNRTKSKAVNWQKSFGGKVLGSISEVAEISDIVFLCLGRDEDVREVVAKEKGLLDSMKTNSIIVDHTTTSADLAKEMFLFSKEKDIHFIDAPVSGGEVGAKKGLLTVMAGGESSPYREVEPFIMSYSKHSQLMGKTGSGQLTKMVNQICLAGLIQALAEGLNFSERAGLNGLDVINVISKGAAQSWQMDNRAESMLEDFYEHGFAVDLMRKDLGIAMKEANKNNSYLEVVNIVDSFYEDIQKMDGGKWDTSSLLRRLRNKK